MRREKGSITLYITIMSIVLIVILSLTIFNIMNRNNNQKKQLEKITDNYSVSEEDMERAYLEAGGENTKHMTLEEVEELIQKAKDEVKKEMEAQIVEQKEKNSSQEQEIESLKTTVAAYETKSEYKPGDKAIFNNAIWVSGTITTSGTAYVAGIFLDKPISTEVKSITVSSGVGLVVRQNESYLLGGPDYTETSGFSIDTSILGLNYVGMAFIVPTKHPSSINNDAIGVEVRNLTLNFN